VAIFAPTGFGKEKAGTLVLKKSPPLALRW